MKNHNKNKGFTLIELLVVIAVIGVLSGVVMQSLNSARVKSRNAVRLENADAIAKAFQVATTGANNNQFPSSGSLWRCLGTNNCWGTTNLSPLATINSVLNTGLAGGKAPTDPVFTNAIGDTFAYHSSFTDSSVTGTYIMWEMEGQNGYPCGRGYNRTAANITDAPNYRCILHLGPPTP